MTRRRLLSALAATLMLVTMAILGTGRASAQSCCTYQVIVSGAYPAACTQFKVLTRWNGAAAPMGSVGITGTGSFTYPVPYVCPPTLTLTWVSFNGGVTTYPLGYSGPVVINGCNRTLTVQLSVGGCLQIIIS